MLAIATGTRADWGLLKPLADRLTQRGKKVEVIATNMHLDPRYGMTVEEIRADGYEPLRVAASGTPAEITSSVLLGFTRLFSEKEYEAVVILGDRFEMLGVASAALLSSLPIIHIAGGTVSEGAFDDAIRNSITQMASLHLVETDNCRRRVTAMGKDEASVVTTGALGVYNFLQGDCASLEELEDFTGMKVADPTLLVTLHAATLSPVAPEAQMRHLIDALTSVLEGNTGDKEGEQHLKGCRIIFTYPNNDSHAPRMIEMIEEFRNRFPDRVAAVASLGRRRYMSALRHCAAVIGNSSSGIVEVPSAHIPALDIGLRQKGRERADSVFHCSDSVQDITDGILCVTSPDVRNAAKETDNPYHRPDTPSIMADAIMKFIS